MADKMIKFLRGNVASLPAQATEGALYFTTDEGLYLGLADGTYHRYGDYIIVDNVDALPATGAHESCMYYCVAENILARWNGTTWIQINKQKTLAELGGVAKTVYDAKVASLEQADTNNADAISALSDKVGTVAEGKTVAGLIATAQAQADKGVADAAAAKAVADEAKAAIDGAVEAATAELDYTAAGMGKGKTVKSLTQVDGQIAAEFEDIEIAQSQVTGLGTTLGEINQAITDEASRADTAEKANAAAAAAAMTEAQKKVASVTAGDASVTVGGTATAPTVAVKLSPDAGNSLELAEDGLKVVVPSAAEYSIVKAENSGEFAAVYNLTKNGAVVGASINIPKDMVVQSGAVVEDPVGQPAGTYIKLVLQNVDEPLYINVGSLIEYVTSGSAAGDMVVVSVSDDHKVTATITDGTITLAKLATEVQTAIGKAHTHENATVLAGITEQKVADWDDAVAKEHEHANKDLLDSYTQTEENLADAVAKKHEHANAAELAKIADGDKAKWDQAVSDIGVVKGDYLKSADKTALEGKITAEANRADAAEKALAGRLDTLEQIDHTAYVAADEQVLAGAKEYAAGLVAWGEF